MKFVVTTVASNSSGPIDQVTRIVGGTQLAGRSDAQQAAVHVAIRKHREILSSRGPVEIAVSKLRRIL
ncbi:hypothetical protein [Salinispora vitiensis]|uniref:hypothetical protein n=1 Tax=Salinispora vitiensis TaxID=999544 RepID=UPI0003662AA3|nr:hypothetical protein [Salinispora vitiensis]